MRSYEDPSYRQPNREELMRLRPTSCRTACTLLEILTRLDGRLKRNGGNPPGASRPVNGELVKDLCRGCCPSKKACAFKRIVARLEAPDRRTWLQIKCAETLYRAPRGPTRVLRRGDARVRGRGIRSLIRRSVPTIPKPGSVVGSAYKQALLATARVKFRRDGFVSELWCGREAAPATRPV